MEMGKDVWQGTFGYWQNLFIRQNLLLLGYTAWKGYLKTGRGMVVCHIADPVLAIDWSVSTIPFERTFIPQAEVERYLQDLEQTTVAAVLNTVTAYNPEQAIIVLVFGNGEINLTLLQNLKILPLDCYRQVERRWTEFQLDCPIQERS